MASLTWEKSRQPSFCPLLTDFQQHWMRVCGHFIKCHPLNHKVMVWTLSPALQYCQLVFEAHSWANKCLLLLNLSQNNFKQHYHPSGITVYNLGTVSSSWVADLSLISRIQSWPCNCTVNIWCHLPGKIQACLEKENM